MQLEDRTLTFRDVEQFENCKVNIENNIFFSPVDIGHWVETIPESVDDFSVWTGEHGSVLLAKGRESQ